MAKPNTKSVLESIKALKQGKAPSPAPKQKVEKVEKRKPRPGKQNAGGTGGAREGAGRKPLPLDDRRLSNKRSWENFAEEELTVTQIDQKTGKPVKITMNRRRIVQQKTFELANKGDIAAIKEFNDRTGGKARQPVVGDMEEDPVQIDLGVDRLLEKAYGDEEEDD